MISVKSAIAHALDIERQYIPEHPLVSNNFKAYTS